VSHRFGVLSGVHSLNPPETVMITKHAQTKTTLLCCAVSALIAPAAYASHPGDPVGSDYGGNTAMGNDALYELSTYNCGSNSAC
jgi:hypothetical protein